MPGGEAGIGEIVDVMHGAHEAGNEAVAFQRRQRRAGNAVMRVIDVEAAMLGATKPFDIVGDAEFDHVGGVAWRRRDLEGVCLTFTGAEEAGASGVRRVQHGLGAERRQGFAQIHRMDDAAARQRRMGEHGDAQRRLMRRLAPRPSSLSAA